MTAPTVLITGASSGIGAELARAYAARGARLLLLARRRELLDLLAADLRARGTQVSVYEADVTREGDVARVVADDKVGDHHARPLRDGLRALQLAFREASVIKDAPGAGPGEKYTGPVN